MTEVILALGSNIGDRPGNLQRALDLLGDEGVQLTRVSSVWETAPVPADQPSFYNIAVVSKTSLTPPELLAAAKRVEARLGRRPSRHWGPRPIDVDIVFYGHEVMATSDLVIPHARIAERSFVLAPLSEIKSGPLPVLGATALELLESLDQSGLRRTALHLIPTSVPRG